jgi:hypothetical protein
MKGLLEVKAVWEGCASHCGGSEENGGLWIESVMKGGGSFRRILLEYAHSVFVLCTRL